MTKNQLLLPFKQLVYKHRADSRSINFENFWRHLILTPNIEPKIAKDKRETRSSLEEMGHINTYLKICHRFNLRPFA